MNARRDHIENAIVAARAIAEKLEGECPASDADTREEDAAHTLIHSLNDAAWEAERALREIGQ